MFQNIFQPKSKSKTSGGNSKKGIFGKGKSPKGELIEVTEEPTLPLEEKHNQDLEALKAFENKIQSNISAPDTEEYITDEVEQRKLDALQLDNPFTGK